MQEHHCQESASAALLPSQPPIVRQAPGSNTTMRKYQQLTLAVVAVVSFVAFIFYKHEYERLRYTLEYMDTFGEPPPADAGIAQQCWFLSQLRATTPPAEWTTVAPDISVYSSYWDDNSGIGESKLRTIALVEKTTTTPSELKVKLWYENGVALYATCDMEKAEARRHVAGGSRVFHIVHLLCEPSIPAEHKRLLNIAPNLVQFGTDKSLWTDFKIVHDSDSYKSVIDKSAVCVIPGNNPVQSVSIVEFISFYEILGFTKFVFYGNGLTSVVRKLLNRYVDEMGIAVEEKSFNYIPSLQALHSNTSSSSDPTGVLDYITRQVIELDCMYRHRDTHENVIVLHTNEFLIPNQKQSLLDVLKSLSGVSGRGKAVSEFHLSTQHVCVDTLHPSDSLSALKLRGQTHSSGPLEEASTAILRPHLLTAAAGRLGVPGGITEQHVSPASALVYKYDRCKEGEKHAEVLHLPTRINFASLIERSLLYRKWKVFDVTQ